jgi:hypothetical protein
MEPGLLVFQYSLEADMSRLRVPQSGSPRRADGLWKHTCFEAFVAISGAPGYFEFNFSPSQEWAVYRFDGYRAGMSPVGGGSSPEISVRRFDHRLELDSAVRLQETAALGGKLHLRLALAAVIEEDNGRLSYWALKHAPGKPDFHHPDGFALEL